MDRTSSPPASPRTLLLQFLALWSFGAVQPLLQLIGAQPEFLLVHHTGRADLLIMIAGLFLAVPVAAAAAVMLAGLAGRRVGTAAHGLVAAALAMIVFVPIVDRTSGLAVGPVLAVAATSSLALAALLAGSARAGRGFRWLALAAPAFLALFLANGPILRILMPRPQPAAVEGAAAAHPVVMLICDEFPTASLMRTDGSLDAPMYPNFARLAGMSTWYRNATTVSGATLRAVPAIMTGRFPRWKEAPTVADHPRSIFTLLGRTHHVHGLETQTDLCPDALKSVPGPGLAMRLDLLAADLAVLFSHVATPSAWRDRLTPVDNKWGDYRGTQESGDEPGELRTKIDRFRAFIASIEKHERPDLVVAHVLLPHNPYRFLPGGTIYSWRESEPLEKGGIWSDDELVVAHDYRRHLAQVAALDELLGELLDRLQDQGLLDEALVVVTADHGAGFRPGEGHRRFTGGNASGILSVPLFIKLPGQVTGTIDDRFVQTVDIMPTVAAALGGAPGWRFDGVDLADPAAARRTELDFFDADVFEHRVIAPGRLAERMDVVRWKASLFGEEGDYRRLFSMDADPDLRGLPVADPTIPLHPTLDATLAHSSRYGEVRRNSTFIPAALSGTVRGATAGGRLQLAVAVDGVLAGFTETYLAPEAGGALAWRALVPPEVFRDGSNLVELFLVGAPGAGPRLQRIPLEVASMLGRELGSRPAAGAAERGLRKNALWGERPMRWTDGRARWDIPLGRDEQPHTLHVDLVSTGPAGAQLKVVVNGVAMLDRFLPGGGWRGELPLVDVPAAGHLAIELISSTFVPAERDPASGDHRTLGVAVASLVVE